MFDLPDCLTEPMVQTRGIKQITEYTRQTENLKGGNKQKNRLHDQDATESFVSEGGDAGWLKVKILRESSDQTRLPTSRLAGTLRCLKRSPCVSINEGTQH